MCGCRETRKLVLLIDIDGEILAIAWLEALCIDINDDLETDQPVNTQEIFTYNVRYPLAIFDAEV